MELWKAPTRVELVQFVAGISRSARWLPHQFRRSYIVVTFRVACFALFFICTACLFDVFMLLAVATLCVSKISIPVGHADVYIDSTDVPCVEQHICLLPQSCSSGCIPCS